ncbi:hypothetical protein M9H77_12141 [Catharanthus roseus]|uniref:Uncharacterized protein n=1 Tax=Catharanthus roseus TaxID=4058 RepID=A0ACC0BGM9_CATRO|nr:hypothetical protein M9H77_12141 [Catharanthus roseus]
MVEGSTSTVFLQDRVEIVTGASRGIGQTIALHLASLGAKLVINYTSNSSRADIVAIKINKSAATEAFLRAITAKANFSDPEQVKSLFGAAESAFHSSVHIMSRRRR